MSAMIFAFKLIERCDSIDVIHGFNDFVRIMEIILLDPAMYFNLCLHPKVACSAYVKEPFYLSTQATADHMKRLIELFVRHTTHLSESKSRSSPHLLQHFKK
jgi:hypothetical protein